MTLSSVFIHRPVATTLLTIGLALLGVTAYFQLPIAPLPQVEYPAITVRAALPGASPDTMASSVATPLERALGTIAGVNEITSSSSLGATQISLQFDLDRSLDGAAKEVQAAINAARATLPSGMSGNPSVRKEASNDTSILILSLTSNRLTRAQLYDVADTILGQRLSQVEGVGKVNIAGSSLPAVRVELNPQQLSQMGVSTEQVRDAITSANVNRPKGFLEQGSQQWQINANDQAKKAADYLPLVVSWRQGAAVHLGEVARITDDGQDLRNAGINNGKQAVMLMIQRQPGANIIDTIDRIRALVPQLQASLPSGAKLEVAQDRSLTIRASLRDVGYTLVIAVALVVMVVLLFLRDRRAALIPAVAVPVSLVGTLSFMYLAGFSLNNLSLMALTVATGFVVDDAVVVMENITRHIERGLAPLQAAILGAREVGFTVVSMSLSLIAAFTPILFMGGIVGRLFREFAVTLAVAILVSLVVSLTATPMMCARLLKPAGQYREGRLSRWAAGRVSALQGGYHRSLSWALNHSLLMLFVLLGVLALNTYLYVVIPKGFFPQQDTGRLRGFVQADQSSSFQSMEEKLALFEQIVRSDPAVENVAGTVGGGRRNSAEFNISLKPVSQREATPDQIIDRLRGPLSHVPGASLFLQPTQDIRIGARQSNSKYQYTLLADDLEELRIWEPRIRSLLSDLPELTDVNTDQQDKALQTRLLVDRDVASRLGLTQRAIDTSLNNLFGQRLVSTIYNPLNQYRVVMEAAPQYWQSPTTLQDLTLISPTGQLIPLLSVAHWTPTFTPLAINHQGQFIASTISFALANGVSLGEASTAIRDAVAGLGLPVSIQGSFEGAAKAFQVSMASQPLLIVGAIMAVYLILGMLYESLIHPVTILSTLPSAGIGALLALLACHTEFTVIALIGIILLIGIVQKNAIMMVDFALNAERTRGLSPHDAILEACLLRFRPIMMTTLAAIFGAIPLALGTGDGAELRQPLGISMVGGLIISQLLTLYTTPVIYLYLDRLRLVGFGRRTPSLPAGQFSK